MRRGVTSSANCALNKPACLREAALILSLALVVATVLSFWHPWIDFSVAENDVTVLDAKKSDWAWIDARGRDEYLNGHVPGALNLNEDDWEPGLQKLMATWHPGRKILVYCSSSRCNSSRTVAGRLKKALGTDEVYVLTGGWEAWRLDQSR